MCSFLFLCSHVDQVGLKLTDLFLLPSGQSVEITGMTGMHHHIQLAFFFFKLVSLYGSLALYREAHTLTSAFPSL